MCINVYVISKLLEEAPRVGTDVRTHMTRSVNVNVNFCYALKSSKKQERGQIITNCQIVPIWWYDGSGCATSFGEILRVRGVTLDNYLTFGDYIKCVVEA